MRSITAEDVEAYLEAARDGDHRRSSAIALACLDEGVPVDRVIQDLLAASQRETGLRWLRAQWNVADEHLVTTTTTAVLEAVAAATQSETGRGLLAVVCAEGDWHSMPSRLFAELMRARGWTVRFLGASTPADHLADYLRRSPHDGLAISCALPLHYAGAARLVDVAHELGIPALIGGAAIADDPRRALKLGADIAAGTVDEADVAFQKLGGFALLDEPVLLEEEALLLDAEADTFADAALVKLAENHPMLKGFDSRQLSRTHEDLAYIVRFAAATLLVQDPAVWTTFAAWQRVLLDVRGVPESAFTAGVEAVVELLAARYPHAVELLNGGVARDA